MTSKLDGSRVRKDADLIGAIGVLDELNASLGMTRSISESESISDVIERVQECLFEIGVQMFAREGSEKEVEGFSPSNVKWLEEQIDAFGAEVPALRNFVLPGGCELAARLHVSRTMARRVERIIVQLSGKYKVEESVLSYLNRLSDLLFTLALFANQAAGVPEIAWRRKKRVEGRREK